MIKSEPRLGSNPVTRSEPAKVRNPIKMSEPRLGSNPVTRSEPFLISNPGM